MKEQLNKAEEEKIVILGRMQTKKLKLPLTFNNQPSDKTCISYLKG